MIHQPKRSVTRFFIPLIDVLILLFCIFLMMPLVKEGSTGGGDFPLTAGQAQQLKQEMDLLRRRVAELEATREATELLKDVERLENELKAARRGATERLAIRTFEIDGKTGTLTYRDPDRIEVRNQTDALGLVDRDRTAAATNKRDLYYLILYPRDPDSLHPTRAEREQFERWFRGVPLGWDVPRRGPGGGKLP